MGNQPGKTFRFNPATVLAFTIVIGIIVAGIVTALAGTLEPPEAIACDGPHTIVTLNQDEVSDMTQADDRAVVMQTILERGIRMMDANPMDVRNLYEAAHKSAPTGNPPRLGDQVFVCLSADRTWIGMVDATTMLR